MSLLDKYTEKYGNREQVNRLRKSKDWMPETPTSPEKESNRAAAHSYIDNMTDEDKKRIISNGPLGQSLGMQSTTAIPFGFGKNNANNNREYETYKAATDILQAENYEKKREDVVRQNGSYAYKTMKNYIGLVDQVKEARKGKNNVGNIGLSEIKDLKNQAEDIKNTLAKMGITGKDFDKYEQYVREFKDIEDTQAIESKIANNIAAKPVSRGIGYTAADVLVSPVTGLAASMESLKRPFYADPTAPVNTYSDLYRLQNASNAVEQSVNNQIDNKFGQFAYGVGVSSLKSAEAMVVGNYLSGALGIDAASKLGQLTTLPMFGASAFAQTLQESQAKGFSPEMATRKALASGISEMLFEELSLDKAWGTLKNAKAGKGGLSKRILDVFMGAGIEGSEELFTDLANFMADNFINGDFSDYQTDIRMRVENGQSLNQATKEAKMDYLTQLGESFLAGAASGGLMNIGAATVGSVQYHNTARNINENTKLKSEVVESAKGLTGTTAAEIANNKSVEEINENDMVEILHSMEEVTQKSAHDIAKESLMNAGETEEEAEKKANEIVIMSEQTEPTEAEEKRNIDLVKDDNAANAYADVLKNRIASNVLEDVEKHNAEVKKIKERVKGKEGITAGYNNQEIKVYDFEDVQKGIVATSQGLLDLSEITLPDDMRLLFKNAHALENTKAANAFIDGYKGQSPSYYATGSLRAFMAGASGSSWESFINSKNPLNIKLIEEIGDNAYLKSMYFYGQNSRENAETAKVETSKINPGKVTGENVLNPLLEPLAKKFNVAINTTEGRNKAAGSFVPSELLVTLNKAESNNMLNSVLHETLGEYTKAYAPEAYKLTKQKVTDFARKVFGDTEVDRQIRVYQNTYKGFGKQTGNAAELNKTFADASDEWFNDFMAGLAQTEYGLERVVNYVAEDNNMTAEEKTSVLQSIKDFVKKIIDTIKSYLQGVKSNNIGTKAAKDVEKDIDKYMNDLEDIFNSVEKMCDAAIVEVNKQINAETKAEEKNEAKAHSLNVGQEGYHEDGNGTVIIDNELFKREDVTDKDDFKALNKLLREYLRKLSGQTSVIKSDNRTVYYDKTGAKEYTGSNSTYFINNDNYRYAKANSAQAIKAIVEKALNPRWEANTESKHNVDAQRGWTDYDVSFGITEGNEVNYYSGKLNVRMDADGKDYVYDVDLYNQVSKKKEVAPSSTSQDNVELPLDTNVAHNDENSNSRHSLNVDSTGSSLSPEQAEFFKDSKARDAEGRLLVMYHGTDAYKEFTVFKPGKNGYLGKGMYFTEKKYIAEKYAEQNGYEGRVYQVYLNIKNPLVVTSDNPALEILGEKVAARRAEKNSYSTRWLTPADINKLKAKGYDGIIWKYGKSPIEISVWDANQVKNTDNLKPTENEDIRYSLNVDANGKELSEDQIKFFAKAETRDESGKLKSYYHGTAKGGFTVFDVERSEGALFFSDKKSVSESYSGSMLYDLNARMWDENGTTKEKEEFRRNNGKIEYWTLMNEEDADFGDKLIKYATFDSIEKATEWWCDTQGIPYDVFKEQTFKQDEEREMFEVYLNVVNPYVLDANGSFWNRLYIPEEINDNTGAIIKIRNFLDLSNIYIDGYANEEDLIESLGNFAQGVRDFAEMQEEDGYDVDHNAINKLIQLGEEIDNIYNNWNEEEHIDEDEEPIKFANYIRQHKLKRRNTRDVVNWAKMHGHDGVIFKNIVDVGWKNVNGYEESEVVAVFRPSQVKDTDNLHPTVDVDINYSLDVEDWEKDFFAEMTGNMNVSNILTEGLKSLDNIKLNKKITDKIAKEVKEEYKSKIKVSDLSDSLEKVFSYMLDTGAPSYGDLVSIMKEVAMPVVDQATEIMPEEKHIWDDFKEKMKGYRIKLNPQQKAEVANTFGTYYAFKNDMFGNVIFSESGTDLDSIWTEICDASGGLLDYAENPANQPMALYEFVEALKPTPSNIYGADQEAAAYDVALTIFRKFLVEQEYENNPKLRKEALKLTEAQQTYKKRVKENYEKKFKEETEALRREKEINMKRLATEIKYLNEEEKAAIEGSIEQALILRQKRQYEWRLQKLRETKNDEMNRKLSELRAKQRASVSRRVEGRQITLAKAKIRKNVEKLNSMLAHGTENRHIPKNMVLSTIAMLESIDINTGNSKGMAQYLQKMEDIYRSFKDNDVYTDGEKAASFDYDERTAANIEALRKLFDGRNYTQLTLSELKQVIDITDAVITQAENANKLLGKEKREYATDFARTAAQEVRNAKVKDSRFMTNLDHYMTQHLNAYREFRKLSGYEDGKLMELYYDLDKGQQKQLQVMKDINAIFDDVLKDRKEVKRLTSTDKKDLVDSGLKDENGKPVMITRAERLSLIMHSYNKSNMQHLLYGGISVPDLSYKDPKQQKAHAKTYYYESQMELRDAILDKNANKLDLIEQRATMKVKELEKQLSDWEKQFLEATKEMFWKTTGRLINETSLELKGYTLARVANYFPIKTDTDYTKSDVSGLIFDGTIEGMGFLKERRFGRNAMMLEDITDTILRQTQSVAKYVGLAIPVRNFNMVWNTVTRSPMGNADTLKKAISLTWGAKNTDYIVNLMKDLNGRRDGGEPSAFDTLRGRFAGAVLTLNPSVAIKQAASYFTAGAKVGNLTLAKTLKDLGKGFILKKGIPELEAINPLLWYRNQGNATQELADMKAVGFGKSLPIWAQKALNWVEFMDTGTVRTLEYAAKNYVDANYKDLKGAEYWQKVSDVFTSIVEETQPNYTVLQQADIIRDPNRLRKALVMFKTQPLQNFGTVYDAVGEYAAKVRKGNKAEIKEAGKHLAWALSSQIASAVTFSVMTILADMILHKQYKYKDDDDKFSWLNVLAKFGAGVRDCFLGAMIAGQEVYAIIDHYLNKMLGKQSTYYGLEVSFLGEIKDIVDSIGKLGEESVKRLNAVTEADRDKYNQGILIDLGNVVSYTGQLAGVPLGNIKNMFQSLILYAIDVSNGTIGEAELSRDVPNQYERMYDALQNKDSERYGTLFDEMVTKKMRDAAEDGKEKDQEDIEKSVETSVKKYIKDGYNSGELTYDEAYTILTKEFGMEEDDAYFKLDEWLYKSEGHEDYTRYIRLSDAVNGQGDIQKEIDTLKAQGIEEDTIKTQLTGILKEDYYKGTLSKDKITQVLKKYEDLDDNDIYYKFKEWDFKKTHPDESFSRYDAMNNAIKEVINGSDNRKPMMAEIEDLMKHGVEAKTLQSQLTKEYKPLYLELKAQGKASTLKNVLISAYMATGLSREDAAKRIDKWKENDK